MALSAEEKIHRANQLKDLRKNLGRSPLQKAKSVAKKVSPFHTVALINYFNYWLDWLYGIALSVAILKDILNYTGLGSLPGIGTVLTWMASITIFAIMLITGNTGKAKWARRIGVWLFATFLEMIFGIDFIPWETFMVIIVYWMVLDDRRTTAEAKKAAQEETARQRQMAYAEPDFA